MDDAASMGEQLLSVAHECGASLAGFASAAQLKGSPSQRASAGGSLPESIRSVLVLALHHPESDAELDYWGGRGGTRGNLRLTRISREVSELAARRLDIVARPIDYAPEPRGTFLKDAAALAGLGVIGRNNLLITPRFGPRVRLRALALEAELPASSNNPFSPCSQCDMVCRRSCPQQAFAPGTYQWQACALQMKEDESTPMDRPDAYGVAYCRRCELSCPVGKG
jgi:epoxyqueuosine reductase